jgi:nucleoside-diphosphate-sugar epimerase
MPLERVLITGASGNLAPFIIEHLHAKYQLTLTSRSVPNREYHDCHFVQADLTDYDQVVNCVVGHDAVIHLAAVLNNRLELPASVFADGMVKGTWHIAEACVGHGVRRVVNMSSILACGRPEDLSKPYRMDDPSSFSKHDLLYPLAKNLAERVLDAYHDAYGLSVIHLRPGVIASDPRYPPPAPPAELKAKQYWFRHVDPRDIAQAVEQALTTQLRYGCYHLIAGRMDAMFDWTSAARELGYQPVHNWPDIPDNVERPPA